jgi:urea transporter
MSGPPSFLEELKRRKVVRAAAVYGAVVFVVIQVADIVFPALGFPEWTFPFVLVLCLLGFPLTLALSWSFDLTSQGVKRTEDEPS